jgi:hypothetical protein
MQYIRAQGMLFCRYSIPLLSSYRCHCSQELQVGPPGASGRCLCFHLFLLGFRVESRDFTPRMTLAVGTVLALISCIGVHGLVSLRSFVE